MWHVVPYLDSSLGLETELTDGMCVRIRSKCVFLSGLRWWHVCPLHNCKLKCSSHRSVCNYLNPVCVCVCSWMLIRTSSVFEWSVHTFTRAASVPQHTLLTNECESNPSDGRILSCSSGIWSVCGPNQFSSRAAWQQTLHRVYSDAG